MDKLETEFLDKYLLKPCTWLRYIDDILFVWSCSEERMQQFAKTSAHQVNFPDVIVKLQENEFLTDLYCKKTDCHQYLHYDSCHPECMKKSSVCSQELQIKRLCSDSKHCETHLKNLKR